MTVHVLSAKDIEELHVSVPPRISATDGVSACLISNSERKGIARDVYQAVQPRAFENGKQNAS